MNLKLPAGASNYKWTWTKKIFKKIHVINAGTSLIQTKKGKQTELHFKEYETIRCTTN